MSFEVSAEVDVLVDLLGEFFACSVPFAAVAFVEVEAWLRVCLRCSIVHLAALLALILWHVPVELLLDLLSLSMNLRLFFRRGRSAVVVVVRRIWVRV